MKRYRYVCEVCGRVEILTQDEAYNSGWDYPPFMGAYGVVSARTCPNCTITETAWMALMSKKKYEELTERQKEAIHRILGEPANMEVAESSESENESMKELTEMLIKVPDSYFGFERAVIVYCSKKPQRLEKVMEFMKSHPDAGTSDILTFVSHQEDFYEDAAPCDGSEDKA